MNDRTLRRNRYPTSATPNPSLASNAPHTEQLATSAAQRRARLSPHAQKWQVIATVRHFRAHYLAELTYIEAGNVTVATLRPYLAAALGGEPSFEIRVDGRGHTSIIRLEEERRAQALPIKARAYRFFVVLLILAALTSGALALFL